MESPVDRRLRAARSAPSGHIVPSGVDEFLACLNGQDALAAFATWRSSVFARKMYLALQDLILHQPVDIQAQDALVQYGITQGLSLASRILMDPSVVWPGAYGDGTKGYQPPLEEPPMDFSTSADEALFGSD